jgi:hypothetical protein
MAEVLQWFKIPQLSHAVVGEHKRVEARRGEVQRRRDGRHAVVGE